MIDALVCLLLQHMGQLLPYGCVAGAYHSRIWMHMDVCNGAAGCVGDAHGHILIKQNRSQMKQGLWGRSMTHGTSFD